MKYPKLRELREAFTALIKGPYTTKFPKEAAPAAPAYRGKPEFQPDYCVVCGACANVCPSKVIEIEEGLAPRGKRKMILHYDRCIFCGECERNCLTEKGIHLTGKYDLAVLDRKLCVEEIEDDLVFCEHCQAPVTTRKHLNWLVEKLGPYVFSNPNLFMASHRELELLEKTRPDRKEQPLERSDFLKILCPKCRKQLTLKEEWGQQTQ